MGRASLLVEVKTRVGAARGTAEESLTTEKARRLAVAAEWYLADHPDFDDPSGGSI
ncbi:MAG: YraN family protein [Thermomicrobiales bacterium]